jgi:anti-sigma factor RsiW
MNEQDNCLWFDGNLNAYLDGELDREAREKMNAHARSCPACGQKLETMTRLLTMCAELDEGLSVPLEAQSAWRKAIRAEAQGHARKRNVDGWTRGLGWIAVALTLLTVSTAVFNQGVTVPPFRSVQGQCRLRSARVTTLRSMGSSPVKTPRTAACSASRRTGHGPGPAGDRRFRRPAGQGGPPLSQPQH